MSSSSPITTWLVTGASRGLGLELVKQILDSSNNVVVAACRAPEKAEGLNSLKAAARGTLHLVRLDVSDFDQIRASAKDLERILQPTGLDYLINNAAIAKEEPPSKADPEDLMQCFRTNVAGPAVVYQVCLPFLEKGNRKTVVNISSTVGSLTEGQVFGARGTAYAVSKTALNMLTVKQKLERPDLIFLTMCPGWMKTDMGGKSATLDPKDSAAGLLKIITSATAADSGKYLRYTGEEIVW